MNDMDSAERRSLLRWWPDYVSQDHLDASSGDDGCVSNLWGGYRHTCAMFQQRQLEKNGTRANLMANVLQCPPAG
jgi:hypothetical protein